MQILTGSKTDDAQYETPVQTIRFYLGPTRPDGQSQACGGDAGEACGGDGGEACALVVDVVPYLEEFARRYSVNFSAIALQCGVTYQTAQSIEMVDASIKELSRCQIAILSGAHVTFVSPLTDKDQDAREYLLHELVYDLDGDDVKVNVHRRQ